MDGQAAAELALAASHVVVMARVHQHIYMSDTLETTECASYLKRLCEGVSDVLPEGCGPIVVEAITAELPTEQITPLGLILNKLVTNAAKHGKGVTAVALEHQGETGYVMNVSDVRKALPKGFDPFARSGLGIKVVGSLTNQLGGLKRRTARLNILTHKPWPSPRRPTARAEFSPEGPPSGLKTWRRGCNAIGPGPVRAEREKASHPEG